MLPANTHPLIRRLIAASALLIITMGCIFMYGQYHSYAPVKTAYNATAPQLTNPEILQNWLPPAAYSYAVKHIYTYITENKMQVTSMTAQANVNSGDGSYNFTILLMPQGQALTISVHIENLDGLLSTAITINGVLQTTTVPSTVTPPPSSGSVAPITFNGVNALIDHGVTASQANVFEQAFLTFKPATASVAIDTAHITSILDSNSDTLTYGFPVSVDGTSYTATLKCIGSTQAQVLLADPTTNRTVFNSGIVTGQ